MPTSTLEKPDRRGPKALTPFTVEKARSAKEGKRRELFDTQAPGLCLRVTGTGHRAYYWRGRVSGMPQPIRVWIGDPRLMELGDARELARAYAKQAAAGEDPRLALKAKEAEEAKARDSTFGIVAERFITEEVSKLSRPKTIENLIRRDLMPAWRDRPIATITRADIGAVLNEIKVARGNNTALVALNYTKVIFKWAASLGQSAKTRLEINPASEIAAKDLQLSVPVRQVALKDDQLKIVWKATTALPAAWRNFIQMLVLTGLRRNEVAFAEWGEINLAEKTWIVPAERMKGKPGKRRAHLVPLTAPMLAILEQIKADQPEGAEYVFSTTNGSKPLTAFSQLKIKLDKTVKALAVEANVEMPKIWRFHDLRRTVRTGFAKMELQIPPSIAERVLAHVQGGIEAVYNVHDYAGEKRQALTLWADRLAQIVGENVVTMQAAE